MSDSGFGHFGIFPNLSEHGTVLADRGTLLAIRRGGLEVRPARHLSPLVPHWTDSSVVSSSLRPGYNALGAVPLSSVSFSALLICPGSSSSLPSLLSLSSATPSLPLPACHSSPFCSVRLFLCVPSVPFSSYTLSLTRTLCAWLAWFLVLFYTTKYITDVYLGSLLPSTSTSSSSSSLASLNSTRPASTYLAPALRVLARALASASLNSKTSPIGTPGMPNTLRSR
ncbi:hypothetical protein FB451DRAFT_1422158 [Mycena latifolia]|nr:hypothetical protein FB451DRAFT_1422158 [Mycena latifolia]